MNLKNKIADGKFIVICGGEGSGKSSLLHALEAIFSNTVFTREPGGPPYAEAIRDMAIKHPLAKDANADTIFAEMWASRADAMHHCVVPALANGQNVISDRGDCCTYAYQIHAQGGEHLEKLFWNLREVFLRDKVPDLYIFLDVSPEIGLKRVAGRAGKKNHFDERDMAFHETIRQGYLAFFDKIQAISDVGESSSAGTSGFIIVDASRSIDEVRAEVVGTVQKLFQVTR